MRQRQSPTAPDGDVLLGRGKRRRQLIPPPRGPELTESCAGCKKSYAGLLCGLEANALSGLDGVRFTSHPRGAVLFVEGQTSSGVYVVCSGRVKLSTSSGEARLLITHLAGPGEVLGLVAVVSGRPYEVTAETLEPTDLNFIRRAEFTRFLSEHPEAMLRMAGQLADTYRTAFNKVRLLGLAGKAAGKLALLLLDCADRHGRLSARGVVFKLTLTHEEIGQLIGASRETVTRHFSGLKGQRLIEVCGATLTVLDFPGLEAVASA